MPGSKTKLLIVDDEPVIVELITKMLAVCAYDVRNACNGEQAVLIAREFHPDCVVTGIMMPRMGGFPAAIAILQFLPRCKFIFVSGCAHDAEVRAEYECLGLDFRLLLAKPFQRLDLLKALALINCPCSEVF